ncbi:PTS sugar transporter subunit IIB, partial [Salmonella enterica]|nr:PTS sugar transporter subunit IIB [Salmonella enterica]
YNNPKYAGERVMLLFTNPTDVERIVEGGVKVTSVNIGGMAYRQGKTQVNNAVSVDEKDIEAFKKLNERGIELEVRKVSTDPKLKMMDLIAKVAK